MNTRFATLETEAERAQGGMRAFVMHRIGKTGVMEKPLPEIGAGDALIRTTAALICTSDVHAVAGAIGECENRTVEKLGSKGRGFSDVERGFRMMARKEDGIIKPLILF
jgi:NADPH:quinone reductase-like Zn-dependent oxidoreductase